MPTVEKLTLKQRPIAVAAQLFGGALAVIFLFVYWLGTGDQPFPVRFAVGLFPLALVVLCFAGAWFVAQPVSWEVDERGVRQYRRGHLWSDIPWDRVAWVAFGHWTVGVATTFTRRKALCLLVRGPRVRKSIGLDSVTYSTTEADVTNYAQTVVDVARSRSIAVLSKPRL